MKDDTSFGCAQGLRHRSWEDRACLLGHLLDIMYYVSNASRRLAGDLKTKVPWRSVGLRQGITRITWVLDDRLA